MNSIDLSGLKGLHIPSEPSVFPFAIGWWILVVLLFFFILGFIFFILCFLNSEKRFILKELKRIRNIEDTRKMLLEFNSLAKKMAIAKFGREKVASLYDKKWIDFLNSGKKEIFSQDYVDLLHKSLYAKDNTIPDSLRKRIISDYSKWIRSFNRQRLEK